MTSGQPGLVEGEALRVGAVVGVEGERDGARLHADRVEDVGEPDALPVDVGHAPPRDALEVLHELGARHRLEVREGEGRSVARRGRSPEGGTRSRVTTGYDPVIV